MNKVEDGDAIPKTGQENPRNEAIPAKADVVDSRQEVEDESVMSLEIALVRALQQLGKASEEN
jgi:hypothetical protein